MPETSVSARATRNNSGLMARVVILWNTPERSTSLIALATEGEISELSFPCAPSCSPGNSKRCDREQSGLQPTGRPKPIQVRSLRFIR